MLRPPGAGRIRRWGCNEDRGPALVEVPVRRRELAMRPSISLEQMTGFGMFMFEAVLSGRGDEIVDLAKTNLWR